MLPQQRQEFILAEIRRAGGVRVGDLVRELGVSDMTVRRDLETLAERGLVRKVHGGATAPSEPTTAEPGFAVKSSLQLTEKQAIAAAAARLVPEGTAIGISAGTTTHALAQHIVDVPGLTVVTNSVPVAEVFYRRGRSDQTVILTGGVRTPSDALVGPFAEAALRSMNVDVVFMGVHGVDPQAGFTTPNLMEAESDRALVAAARRLIVVADSSKWRVIGLSSIARLDEADVLVSDDGLDEDARAVLREHVGQLVIAPSQAPRLQPATEQAAQDSA
ncbi:MAG TPA: DeoR/GlpR family DNA-binding transcription regulator [Egibacteraceae bacterium]|nr:DeoR/GlpR family DNA-binding transcription regulator [Egibacteraceae bacterium]